MSGPEDQPTRARRRSLALVASASGLALALLAVAAIRARAPLSSAASPPPPSIGEQSAGGPTVAESSSVKIAADTVEVAVVLRGTGGEEDVARARYRAVLATVEELERTLASSVREANAAAAPNVGPLTTAERFTRDVGTFASPERMSVLVDGDAGFPRLSARYRIDRRGWDKALAFYGSTREAFGITFARALPNRRDGLLVVAVDGAQPDLSRGAVLVSLDERPATSGFDVLPRTPMASHNAVFVMGTATIPVKLK